MASPKTVLGLAVGTALTLIVANVGLQWWQLRSCDRKQAKRVSKAAAVIDAVAVDVASIECDLRRLLRLMHGREYKTTADELWLTDAEDKFVATIPPEQFSSIVFSLAESTLPHHDCIKMVKIIEQLSCVCIHYATGASSYSSTERIFN
eukprot:13502-Heterococcus_DN1.PRE.7